MIRRPPRSTLFPSRRSSDLGLRAAQDVRCRRRARRDARRALRLPRVEFPDGAKGLFDRSEEHTSELHSRQYLVCRLLLEKKNTIYLFLFLKHHFSYTVFITL